MGKHYAGHALGEAADGNEEMANKMMDDVELATYISYRNRQRRAAQQAALAGAVNEQQQQEAPQMRETLGYKRAVKALEKRTLARFKAEKRNRRKAAERAYYQTVRERGYDKPMLDYLYDHHPDVLTDDEVAIVETSALLSTSHNPALVKPESPAPSAGYPGHEVW